MFESQSIRVKNNDLPPKNKYHSSQNSMLGLS